jgi:excisionase family DNA binding protein
MPKGTSATPQQWAALGEACQLLQVNEATLRRWADRGLVRSYRTPGGHRRFAQEDLRALTERSHPSPAESPGTDSLAQAALRHIRRRLHQRAVSSQAWHEHILDQDRPRLRLFGHRILTLASDFALGHGKKQALLAEARLVGEEYGDEAARLGLPLEHTVQAFAFFRNSLVESLQEAPPQEDSPASVYRTWRQVNTITDEVLQGTTRSYDRHYTAKKTSQP